MLRINCGRCGPKNRATATSLNTSWANLSLEPCPPVTRATLAADLTNARNMARSHGRFSVPWDVHPASLRATFAHNTDLIMSLDEHAVPSAAAPVGVRADSPIGLGGGACNDTLRDAIEHGNIAEAIGRRRALIAA